MYEQYCSMLFNPAWFDLQFLLAIDSYLFIFILVYESFSAGDIYITELTDSMHELMDYGAHKVAALS